MYIPPLESTRPLSSYFLGSVKPGMAIYFYWIHSHLIILNVAQLLRGCVDEKGKPVRRLDSPAVAARDEQSAARRSGTVFVHEPPLRVPVIPLRILPGR